MGKADLTTAKKTGKSQPEQAVGERVANLLKVGNPASKQCGKNCKFTIVT